MLEYILQNGGIMKLQIIINKKQSVEKIATYYEDENELQLIFKNTKEYLAFLKRRELTKDDFMDIQDIIEEHEKLEDNSNDLEELLDLVEYSIEEGYITDNLNELAKELIKKYYWR